MSRVLFDLFFKQLPPLVLLTSTGGRWLGQHFEFKPLRPASDSFSPLHLCHGPWLMNSLWICAPLEAGAHIYASIGNSVRIIMIRLDPSRNLGMVYTLLFHLDTCAYTSN